MTHPQRMIPDDQFFAVVWRSPVPVKEIAVVYGTSRAAIYRAAQRFKHGPKNIIHEPVPEPEPRPVGYEAELIWSAGRWSILRDIASIYGRTMTQVQADFHKVRRRG